MFYTCAILVNFFLKQISKHAPVFKEFCPPCCYLFAPVPYFTFVWVLKLTAVITLTQKRRIMSVVSATIMDRRSSRFTNDRSR